MAVLNEKWVVRGAMVAAALMFGPPVSAQVGGTAPGTGATTSAASPALEEIIVTAQKREQRLEDVPLSVSVFSGQFIADQNISDLRELGRHTPNTQVVGEGAFVVPVIRGFRTEWENRASEQAVGLSIDGIPYGRSPYFLAGLFDLKRVEVLRGPQGTLFGTNATAGVFNITTEDPTDELTGYISGLGGDEGQQSYRAAVGGPLVKDSINFRIAGIYEERDGGIRNTTASLVQGVREDLGGTTRKGIRAKLEFPDLLGANVVVSYERTRVEQFGLGSELIDVPSQNIRNYFLSFDANADFTARNRVSSIALPESGKYDTEKLVANATYHIKDWTLQAVADHSEIESYSELVGSGGGTPLPLTGGVFSDEAPQSTVELRLLSPKFDGALGSASFMAGAFYQERELNDDFQRIVLYPVNIIGLIIASSAPEGTVPVTDMQGQGFGGPTETSDALFNQRQRIRAGFAQADWQFKEHWTLTAGVRLHDDSKDARTTRTLSSCSAGGSATTPCEGTETPGVAPLFTAIGANEFDVPLSNSETKVAPNVSLQYEWRPAATAYARWTKGFRNAGFNDFSTSGAPDKLTFKSEDVQSYEVGAKMRSQDGALMFNAAVFRMDMTDAQVFVFEQDPVTSIPSPGVTNAPKVRSQGVEADLTWATTDWLTLTGAVGFTDAEFVSFSEGPCAADFPDRDGDGNPACDLSGKSLPFAPRWNAALSGNVDVPLRWNTDFAFRAGASVIYQDSEFISSAIDDRMVNPSVVRVDGTIGIADTQRGWFIRAGVRNLTDETLNFFAASLTGSPPAIGGAQESTPRLYYGEIGWSF